MAHSREKIGFGTVGFLGQIQRVLQHGPGIFLGTDDIRNITADQADRMVAFITSKDVDLFVFFTAVVGKVGQRQFITLRFFCQSAEDNRQRE